MKKKLFFFIILFLFFIFIYHSFNDFNYQKNDKIVLLKEMFDKMVIQKNSSLIPFYYHKDFLLYTNEKEINYESFLKSHEKIYNTDIQYQVDYDDKTFLEENNKIAGRMWITTQRPKESPKKIEVILIVEFKDEKIYRLWELTYPDWSKLPAFDLN